MAIPLVAIEEHNEAFFVWYHARDAGWLADGRNILLHVDDHADLRLPASRAPLPPRRDPVAAASYTYTRTNIANFIWPTVYSGVFDKVYWLRRKHTPTAGSWRRVALSYAPDRLPRAWQLRESLALEPVQTAPGEVAGEYAPIEPGDRLRPAAPLALDIDLDYFSANAPPDRTPTRWTLEDTFARDILANPYHWARVEGFPAKVEQGADGRWVMSPLEDPLPRPRPEDWRPPDEVIPEALTRFGAYLDEFNIRPALITICRSEYSGYTPKSFVQQIEHGVRALLQERYDIEEWSLNELLPERWQVPTHLLRQWPWQGAPCAACQVASWSWRDVTRWFPARFLQLLHGQSQPADRRVQGASRRRQIPVPQELRHVGRGHARIFESRCGLHASGRQVRSRYVVYS